MFTVALATTLPDGIDELARAAIDEGHGMVRRLADTYRDGSNRFDGPGEALWEARGGGRLIGVCGLNRDPFAAPYENAGRVRRLYVDRNWRRRGVATTLVNRVIAAAHLEFSLLTAFTTDPAAAGFYVSRGFDRVIGVTKRSFVLPLSPVT